MTPDRTEKPALPCRGAGSLYGGDRAAGKSSVLPEPEEPDRAAEPDASVPSGGMTPDRTEKPALPCGGAGSFYGSIVRRGNPLFCRSQKSLTGQQTRTPPYRTGNDPRQNRKTGASIQGRRFFFMMDSQRRASQKQDCSAWVIPSLRCRERDFSLSVKIWAKGILPWLKCRSIMKLSRS